MRDCWLVATMDMVGRPLPGQHALFGKMDMLLARRHYTAFTPYTSDGEQELGHRMACRRGVMALLALRGRYGTVTGCYGGDYAISHGGASLPR